MEKIVTGEYVAVICKVLDADSGVYPDMHYVMPITDDNITFMACNKAIAGKANWNKEEGWHIAEESAVGDPECDANLGGE